jgi:hypothetical protein
MTVELNDRDDFTLENLKRVAWQDESVVFFESLSGTNE